MHECMNLAVCAYNLLIFLFSTNFTKECCNVVLHALFFKKFNL